MAEDNEPRVALAHGNPADGFDFIGPFDNAEEAIEYAERSCRGEWSIINLVAPITWMTHEAVENKLADKQQEA